MTPQEVFDKIYAGTRTQKTRAVDLHGECAFITDKGERCFMGMLMSEDLAHAAEAGCWGVDDIATAIRFTGVTVCLSELMFIHDDRYPSNWDASLAKLAKEHGAVYPPKEATP